MAEPLPEGLHGGRVYAAARALGLDPSRILDFSANLNPLGPPEGVLRLFRESAQAWITAYPDPEAPGLRQALGAKWGVADDQLVVGHGGAALLFLALRALGPRRVLLPEPCFQEQPRAVAACGATAVPWTMPELRLDLEGLDPSGCDAVVLTRPHNPTGDLLPRASLLDWSRRHPEVALVVDEAFIDYCQDEQLPLELLERPRTVVLRSLTKFYAMPGLRVGYAFADRDTARRMSQLQEAWPVGQLALEAARLAVLDARYEERTLAAFREDLPAFKAELETLGLGPLPSRAPFLLCPIQGSGSAWAESLAQEGILVRSCAQWPGLGDGYLRLALRRAPDRKRLVEALARRI